MKSIQQSDHEPQTQRITPLAADSGFGGEAATTQEGIHIEPYLGIIAPRMADITIQQRNPPTNIVSQAHIHATFAARQKARRLLVIEFAIFVVLMLALTIVWSALSIATTNTYLFFPLWIALLWGWRIYRRNCVLRQRISVANDVQYQEDADIYERQEEVGLGLLADLHEQEKRINQSRYHGPL